MIKCCQNCHHFRKSGEIFEASGICESGEFKVLVGIESRLTDLLERHDPRVFEELGLGEEDDFSELSDSVAEFFRKHLTDDAAVHIKDAQNFCCNAWR